MFPIVKRIVNVIKTSESIIYTLNKNLLVFDFIFWFNVKSVIQGIIFIILAGFLR